MPNADFRQFWLGISLSMVGSEVSTLAVPQTAVLLLHAGPDQMGALRALGWLPGLLVGLPAGVWVDRLRRRPIMVAADLGRLGLMALIPLAWVLGRLDMGVLFAVVFGAGLLTLAFDVANMAHMPSLVDPADLLTANSRVEMSRSVAGIVGPGLGGVLVGWVGAPLAVSLDALSFAASALCIRRIRRPEPPTPPTAERRRLAVEIAAGLRYVYTHATLRAVALYLAAHFLAMNILQAVYLLYLTRDLRLDPAWIGLIIGMAGPGALVSATLARRVARHWAHPPAIAAGASLIGVAALGIPLAGGPLPVLVATLGAVHFCWGMGITLMSLNQMSMRQGMTPPRLQGRMNASYRSVNLSLATLGALLGGALGSSPLGLHGAVAVGAVGLLLAPVPLLGLRGGKRKT
jgi:predicted MFS family arabinose efflux permease